MTVELMRNAIQETLNVVPFTGLNVAYCTAVRDALRPKMPGAQVDVYFRPRELTVETWLGSMHANVTLKLPG